MWNIQEQEDHDYQMSAASDFQNAYDWNRLNRKPDDSDKIKAALDLGKHVLIEEGTDYCPSTDAIMGSRKCLIGEYDSHEAAEVAMHEKYDGQDAYDSDASVYILPSIRKPIQSYEYSYDCDEIPF